MFPNPVAKSTNELSNPFFGKALEINLLPGPVWTSFEKFRTGGNTALESIRPGSVGTLRTKAQTYRIMLDADFQRLLGWASEAARLQKGLRLVVQAAKVVVKHPEIESLQLLVDSAALIAESPILPVKHGHDSLQLTQAEIEEQSKDTFDLENAEVPRPW